MSAELAGKQLELLKEAMGRLGRVAVLWNAQDAAMTNIFSEIQTAAPVLGVTVHPSGSTRPTEIDSAIATMTADRPDAIFMITDVVDPPVYEQGPGVCGPAPTPDDVPKPVNPWPRVACCTMARASRTCTGAQPTTWIAS